jgi:hypothetical protein
VAAGGDRHREDLEDKRAKASPREAAALRPRKCSRSGRLRGGESPRPLSTRGWSH